MILASTLYETLLELIRADKRGLSLSEEEYSGLSNVVNERIYSIRYKEFENSTDNISAMAPFKVINLPIVLVAAECSLPGSYYNMIGKPRIVDDDTITRRCDLVSQMELDERTDDYLTQPTQTYPVYTLGELDVSDNIILHVYPNDITGNVNIDYLRKANTPYLDYYVDDTTLNRFYLDADDMAAEVPAGATYRDGTAGLTLVESLTVDWEWGNDEIPLILSMFTELMGITLPDQLLVEAGNLLETKNIA